MSEESRPSHSSARSSKSAHKDEPPERGSPEKSENGHGKPHKPPRKRKPLSQRPVLIGVLILILIVLVVGGGLWWRHSRHYAETDDAYIDAVPEQVSPQVSGRVLKVLVDDNQQVQAGQPLVELDPADYIDRLNQAKAATAQSQAQIMQAQAQAAVFEAQVEESRANVQTAQANLTNAQHQLERYRKLQKVNPGAVSAQQMDAAIAAATSAEAQRNAAQKAVAAAQSQIGYAHSLLAAARAGIASAQAQVAEAELNLSYTHVKARIAGQVASKTVADGNVVSAGTPLMALVPDAVYITADFKETQLTYMRPGQPVEIKVDAFPSLKLRGHVDSVQPAAGQSLSMLPAQNATGNWVKVVQRVPVKIDIDQMPQDPGQRLGIGMSVEATVKVR